MDAHKVPGNVGPWGTGMRPGGLFLAGAILLAGIGGFLAWQARRALVKHRDIPGNQGPVA